MPKKLMRLSEIDKIWSHWHTRNIWGDRSLWEFRRARKEQGYWQIWDTAKLEVEQRMINIGSWKRIVRLVENKEGGDREETQKGSFWGSQWSILMNAGEWISIMRTGMGPLDLAAGKFICCFGVSSISEVVKTEIQRKCSVTRAGFYGMTSFL